MNESAPTPAPTPSSATLQLSTADTEGSWGADLASLAADALRFTEVRLGVKLDTPPRIESLMPPDAFYKALGQKPHQIAAVAIAGENRVIINRSEYLAMSRAERFKTLVHEFSHLIVGRKVPGGVPAWLDEGLAMVASDEHSFSKYARLTFAASFGGLIPLEDLFVKSGKNPDSQELAYAQSLSLTRHLLRTRGIREDDPAPLVRKLADPKEGQPLRELLYSPQFLRGFEASWRDSIRTFWSWFGVLAGTEFLWIALSFLFLLAYWRKRRMSKLKEEEWKQADGEEADDKGEVPEYDDGYRDDDDELVYDDDDDERY